MQHQLSLIFILVIGLIHFASAQLSIVRPAHYLPRGFFSRAVMLGESGHMVPDSFYTSPSEVRPVLFESPAQITREYFSPSITTASISPSSPTAGRATTSSLGRAKILSQGRATTVSLGRVSSSGQSQHTTATVDSYTNIGSSNNGDFSVSNKGDYGETVPGELPLRQQPLYAAYSQNN